MPNSEQPNQHHETQLKDVAQIVIGAGMLALPVSMSEDIVTRKFINRF